VSGVLASLVPVFAVILLGRLLKRGRLLADAFWQPAEAITFYIFFPVLVSNTATAKLRGVEVAPMLAALLAGILAVAALTFALRRPLRLDGPAFTSLLQGAIRPNIYVGLAAAQALFGREGLALLSVAVAFAVPLVNVVSVLAMLRWAAPPGSRLGASSILLPLLGNPLIVSCVIGLALNVVGLGLPPLVAPLLEILGRASLPIGLLAVGAGLNLTAIGAASRTVVVASALKLLLLPALTVALCLAFAATPAATAIAALYAALPSSASAYVMARQMGGNAPILAGVITLTTIGAVVSIPAIITLLR
jgi:malonate transporter